MSGSRMTYSVKLEKLLKDIGGCGQFQWILALVVTSCGFVECWSTLHMAFIGQEPNFYCSPVNNTELNETEFAGRSVEDGICSKKNQTQCSRFQFEDEMRTIVSEVVYHFGKVVILTHLILDTSKLVVGKQ